MYIENSLPRLTQVLSKAALLLGTTAFLLLMIFGTGCSAEDSAVLDDSSATQNGAEVEFVSLSAQVLDEFDIRSALAGPGNLELTATFPGEVRVNQDQFLHIVPRVSGIVHSVNFSEGDSVKAGEVLAVLDSQELADVKSDYLAGVERADIAELSFRREERLFEQKISSEAEYLNARRDVTEAKIALTSARQKLLALGFSEEYIRDLPTQPDHALVHYEISAPMGGFILERHISGGEAVDRNAEAFAIADLSNVWVDLEIFQKDLDLIKEGQEVHVESSGGRVHDTGIIRFVRPVVGEETRTAIARIVLDNSTGKWRPGMFVTGIVTTEQELVDIYVPRSAVMTYEGNTVIFSEYEDGFTPREVVLGRENSSHVEVLSGLETGQKFVYEGAFALKAQLAKSELAEGHAH